MNKENCLIMDLFLYFVALAGICSLPEKAGNDLYLAVWIHSFVSSVLLVSVEQLYL